MARKLNPKARIVRVWIVSRSFEGFRQSVLSISRGCTLKNRAESWEHVSRVAIVAQAIEATENKQIVIDEPGTRHTKSYL